MATPADNKRYYVAHRQQLIDYNQRRYRELRRAGHRTLPGAESSPQLTHSAACGEVHATKEKLRRAETA